MLAIVVASAGAFFQKSMPHLIFTTSVWKTPIP
jgi:hypothetical protein